MNPEDASASYARQQQSYEDAPDVSPVIATLMRSWNDGLPDDEARTRLLVPILREGIMRDTAGSAELEERQAYMALDWLIREHLAAWMDLAPALVPHAIALRALSPITPGTLKNAETTLAAVWAAARAAAWAAVLSGATVASKIR